MFSEEFFDQIVSKDAAQASRALQDIAALVKVSPEEAQLLANLLVPHWKSNQAVLTQLANAAFARLKTLQPGTSYPAQLMDSAAGLAGPAADPTGERLQTESRSRLQSLYREMSSGEATLPRSAVIARGADPRIGTIVGSHYQLVKKLGVGGMGEVFQANDLFLKRQVAVKFMSREMGAQRDMRLRFLNEGRLLATVKHPAVVDIHACEVDAPNGCPFLVMELVDGQTLDSVQAQLRADLPRFFRVMIELMEGINACHAKKIVHRDIKPDNLLLCSATGRLKIVDFGIAKGPRTLTEVGTMMGTPKYMSPEQVQGKGDLSEASDIYSIGVVMWELLTGSAPFEAEEGADQPGLAIALKHLREDPPWEEFRRRVPLPGMELLLRCMLDKSPHARPAAVDVIDALRQELFRLPRPAVPEDARRQVVGNTYELYEVIGTSDTSVIHKAFDTSLQRWVALKMLPREFTANEVLIERFITEGKKVATVSHPNVLTIHAADRDGKTGLPYLVMELLEGQRLDQIPAGQVRERQQIIPLLLQVLDGIKACHARGIVHQNLSPKALMVTGNGLLKIFDFGISLSPAQRRQLRGLPENPAYVAPELFSGDGTPGAAADVYSLGVLLWEWLFGQPPFLSQEVASSLVRPARPAGDMALPCLSLDGQDPLAPLVSLSRRMLAWAPGDRPAVDEVIGELERLERVMDGGGNGTVTGKGPSTRRRIRVQELLAELDRPVRPRVYVLVAILLALWALAWWFF